MSWVERSVASPPLLDFLKRCNYVVFATGDYNLNLIAERKIIGVTDRFDDLVHMIYRRNGLWIHWFAEATTDPGAPWVDKATKTVATLAAGQYRSAWRLGMHKGKYKALEQAKPLPVWRDKDRNGLPDINGPLDIGMHGINWHRASINKTEEVGLYSAGCIVQKDADSYYNEFIPTLEISSKKYGNLFTGTLIETED